MAQLINRRERSKNQFSIWGRVKAICDDRFQETNYYKEKHEISAK
jgi:hypothetical protein